MENTTKLPLWLNGIATLFFLSNLFIFGGLSLFSPHSAFPDAGEMAVFPIQFFAIRHIAFAFPLVYGIVKQDVKVLLVCFSMFLVMTTLDVALLFIYDYYVPVLGVTSFWPKLGLALGGFIGPVSLVLITLVKHAKLDAKIV